MIFKSGRTLEQGIRTCVVEGDKLYVSPRGFAAMREAVMNAESRMRPDPEPSIAGLRAAGLTEAEAIQRADMRLGFEVIVDNELRD